MDEKGKRMGGSLMRLTFKITKWDHNFTFNWKGQGCLRKRSMQGRERGPDHKPLLFRRYLSGAMYSQVKSCNYVYALLNCWKARHFFSKNKALSILPHSLLIFSSVTIRDPNDPTSPPPLTCPVYSRVRWDEQSRVEKLNMNDNENNFD